MSQKINPVVAVVIAVVALIAVIFIGVKVMGGKADYKGGSEGTAVVVKPDNPNDPKFTEHLPKNIAGGGLNTGGQ